jgi:hypothetical protein
MEMKIYWITDDSTVPKVEQQVSQCAQCGHETIMEPRFLDWMAVSEHYRRMFERYLIDSDDYAEEAEQVFPGFTEWHLARRQQKLERLKQAEGFVPR